MATLAVPAQRKTLRIKTMTMRGSLRKQQIIIGPPILGMRYSRLGNKNVRFEWGMGRPIA